MLSDHMTWTFTDHRRSPSFVLSGHSGPLLIAHLASFSLVHRSTQRERKKTWKMKREQKDQDQDEFLAGLNVAPAPAQNKSLIRPAGSMFSIRAADGSTQQTNISLVLSCRLTHSGATGGDFKLSSTRPASIKSRCVGTENVTERSHLGVVP